MIGPLAHSKANASATQKAPTVIKSSVGGARFDQDDESRKGKDVDDARGHPDPVRAQFAALWLVGPLHQHEVVERRYGDLDHLELERHLQEMFIHGRGPLRFAIPPSA